MPHPRNPFLYTIPEAALFLEVPPTRIRSFVERGELALHRHGARVYIHVEDLRHLRNKYAHAPAQGPAVKILHMLGARMRVVFYWGNGHERTDRREPPSGDAGGAPAEGEGHGQ